jgi:hypothetical protein
MYKISLITDFQQGKPTAQGYEKENKRGREQVHGIWVETKVE